MFARFLAGEICDAVFGVLLDTRLDGLQYCFLLVFAPHALPVRVSIHFSFSQRFKEVPAFVLRTCPFPLRHLAIA